MFDPLVPAQAETQSQKCWIPAFAAMSGDWSGPLPRARVQAPSKNALLRMQAVLGLVEHH